jgi:ABC-type sugar transport system substrate-binding protein
MSSEHAGGYTERVFLSWSGPESQQVANGLRSWLPKVLPGMAPPWMSNHDIKQGSEWANTLRDQLRGTTTGIVVVTPTNLRAVWLQFEAGALAGTATEVSRIIPYLVGLEAHELKDTPLGHWQATQAAEAQDNLKLVETLHERYALENPYGVRQSFEDHWTELKQVVDEAAGKARQKVQSLAPCPPKSVALLINVKERFNQELAFGLRRVLNADSFRVDERSHGNPGEFELVFAQILNSPPDYVVVVPPSQNASDHVGPKLETLARCGTHVVMIENPPVGIQSHAEHLTVLESDSEEGARLMSSFIRGAVKVGKESRILLLNGPQDSKNARRRGDTYRKELEGDYKLECMNLRTWSQQETAAFVRAYLANHPVPHVIVCGNDTMALSAARTLESSNVGPEEYPKICGYDGLLPAIVAIVEGRMYATVVIPPSSYGLKAATVIMEREAKRDPTEPNPIRITEVVVRASARQLLNESAWAL